MLKEYKEIYKEAHNKAEQIKIFLVSNIREKTDNFSDYSGTSVVSECIFRKNRALAPHERSAVPLGTDHCPVG